MSALRLKFEADVKNDIFGTVADYRVFVLATRIPSGAIETMVNYEGIPDKVKDVLSRYDEDFRLKGNPSVQIVGYLLV